MSQFDAYTKSTYARNLQAFLGKRNLGFPWPLVEPLPKYPGRGRRLGGIPADYIHQLETAVNLKAARCEATDSTVAERYVLARDYANLTDSEVARRLKVTREVVRQWRRALRPVNSARLEDLAQAVNAPVAWLRNGGVEHLPAESHIGVRVGTEALNYREQLRLRTIAGESEQNLSQLCRKAGGRWLRIDGEWVFMPWVPLVQAELKRIYWESETEKIIREELGSHSSVNASWREIKRRCEEKQLAYLSCIGLQKRAWKLRKHAERFGGLPITKGRRGRPAHIQYEREALAVTCE